MFRPDTRHGPLRTAGSRSARYRLTVALVGAIAVVLLIATPTRAQQATLTSQEIYNLISPAVPLIETPLATGSGILIDDRHVLTDAHVVWPYNTASVRFVGSSAITDVPVVGWDLMNDLAVLELPAPSSATPVVVSDASSLSIGSQLFAIGYPGSIDGVPVPTISAGLVSRLRTWATFGVNFIETDAAAASGMSGGALVTPNGEVVGITQFSISGGQFALGASTFDAVSRVERILTGEDVDQLGARFPETSGIASTSHQGTFDHFYDDNAFIVPDGLLGSLTASLDSTADTLVVFQAPWGAIVAVADDLLTGGTEELTINLSSGWPAFLIAGSYDISPADFTLDSTLPLVALDDPDDSRMLTGSGSVFGNIDYPVDVDTFLIQLQAGDTITVTVDSLRIDPGIQIDRADNAGAVLAADDNSGGGFFDLNARVDFTAPETGEYLLIVGDALGSGPVGGYVLNVSIAGPAGIPTGIFSGPLPSSEVGLALWGGGTITQISTAAADSGCNITSYWVSAGGALTGYLFGAPEFVNLVALQMFPGGVVPAGTAMVVLCGLP